MKLPEELLQSLEGVAGFSKESFIAAHEREDGITSIRTNPFKWTMNYGQLTRAESEASGASQGIGYAPVPWTRFGYYLEQRPSFTFDPLFHAGCYYVQEASSMFLEQAFRQLVDVSGPVKVLDLSAAPGGKSTHILSLISPESLLVCNEVIKPRSLILTDNIIKWGCSNVIVTNNDPRAFQKLPGYFDVMVVDAPCSGSGLFRKDEEAIHEWSLNNVALCSQRQQRILADALPALKEGGILVYSTCSYSVEEDEAIMDWLAGEMEMENLPLDIASFEGIVAARSVQTGSIGYRFYPDKIKGEGFFLACFRKKSQEDSLKFRTAKPEVVSGKETTVLQQWIGEEALQFLRFRNEIIALPQRLVPEFSVLQPLLQVQYAGVRVGEVLKEKLVPHHALAQSLVLSPDIPATELAYPDAIKYLQRQELSIRPATTGWQVVRYQQHNLGWINALPNRINNYYPKEIRILKQNNNAFEK